MNTHNVLVGSCGGLTGVYLAKQFKRFSDLNILGADCNHQNACKFFVNDIIKLPNSNDERFISELISALNNKKIDFYVPTHSKEIYHVSKSERLIRENTNTNFIVCPFQTIEAFNNKLDAYKNLSEIGIAVPKIYNNETDFEFPAFIKSQVGSGGVGCKRIYSRQEIESLNDKGDTFLCENIEGDEFTVDCLFSPEGELLGYNQRKRIKCIGGAVVITTNDNLFDVYPYIENIAKHWLFKGAVNFQYIIRKEPVFIDINLRYASGGLPLSVESGVDIPKALYKFFNKQKIFMGEFASDFKNRTMYRYFEELFTDESIS